MMSRVVGCAAVFCCYFAAAFCLWAIGTALTSRQEASLLLFVFGLRMGILLLLPWRYWPGVALAEAAMLWLLGQQLTAGGWLYGAVAGVSLTALLAAAAAPRLRRYPRRDTEWQRPLWQSGVVSLAAALQALAWLPAGQPVGASLLLGLCGGLTIAPACLLTWDYLARQNWMPLGPALIHKPVDLRLRHLMWYCLLFAFSLWMQRLAVAAELRRFVPFCLALPIVFMSYRYGWQGALLATLLNGMVLVATEQPGIVDHRDLLLSLVAQSLTGILLGAGIERQRYLNQQLARRLRENRALSRSLVMAEENTRRNIARELHDEVGQTVTVIRTQASIIRRLSTQQAVLDSAGHIETFALRIYDGVHQLLAQLWPASLSNLPLSEAVAALLRELIPPQQGIETTLSWRIPDAALDDVLKIILYRLCQEGITNACRHARATRLSLRGEIDARGRISLTIHDNGRGIDPATLQQGYGLRGIEERVRAMGGQATLTNRQGACLHILLPADLLRQQAGR